MSKTNLKLAMCLAFSIVISVILLFPVTREGHLTHRANEEKNEERPDVPILSGKEKELHLQYLKSNTVKKQRTSRTTNASSSIYANGQISGAWNYKTVRSGWYGFRVDNSAYDSLNNVFYVVSYAGHLYKLAYENGIDWTLLNHKIVLNPPRGDNPIFFGVHLADDTFRLIRSNDDLHQMEYSDDEGITWTASPGAVMTGSPSNQALTLTDEGKTRIVVHTYYDNYHRLYFSDDMGLTYEQQATYPISTQDMRIVKPFNANDAFMWVWSKTDKTLDAYKYSFSSHQFELIANSESILSGTNLSNVAATYVDSTYHCYINTIQNGRAVYYSTDEGTTWIEKNPGRDRPFEVVSADKPNILISGFEDMRKSEDYGTTWTGYGWRLGWDLQHMRTYPKAGGGHITLAGLDFGCYISETPEDRNSYIWCNDGASYGMHYDVASSENYHSIYMGNQDRGATAYSDDGDVVWNRDVDGTDVLRVAYAQHETAAWSWFYYGRIRHRYNFQSGLGGTAIYDGLGNWWAAPIVPSPNPSEDAIYAAFGSQLQKFSFNASNNSISRTSHPYNFNETYGSNIAGFGYSEIDPNRWYVALNDGQFIYSNDGGENWTLSDYDGEKPRANDQTYNYAKNQIAIRASSLDQNIVYYSGVGNLLMMSEDAGKNFKVLNEGLNIYRMRDFALSPDEQFIFAACGYGGAWVYSKVENQWFQMDDAPVPYVDFTDVEFIKKKNLVRFGSYGSGLVEFKLDKGFNTVPFPAELKAEISRGTEIALNWNEVSEAVDGIYVARAWEDDFEQIAVLSGSQTSYTDTVAEYDQTYFYQLTAYRNDSLSFRSNVALVTLPKEGYLDRSGWQVIDTDSENSGNLAAYCIDGNPSSIWHTQWSGAQPPHPHYVTIDLGQEYQFSGFSYLPRQDGNQNGWIEDYEFYVTNDTSDWGDAVVSGTMEASNTQKEVDFSGSVVGRFVKLIALSEVNDKAYTSVAEIHLFNRDPKLSAKRLAGAPEMSATLNAKVEIFPNPGSERIAVTLPESREESQLRLIDLRGKVLISETIQPGTSQVNLSLNGVPKGVYLIDFYHGRERLVQKFRKL